MKHHAVLIKKPNVTVSEALLLYGNTSDLEVYQLPFSSIGIDEVKQIIFEASLRPQTHKARLLVINLESITHVAEQALLKILEEPPASTSFLFVVPSEITFVPTLQSRFHELALEREAPIELTDFTQFEKTGLAERLEEISKRITKKDSAWVENIKYGLKQHLQDKGVVQSDLLPALSFILTNLNARGASNKMLLEYLAIRLPLCA